MERVKDWFEFLARNHRKVGHREHSPHFVYLNDEKDMLLPAQMHYPFVLFGHNGYNVTEDGDHLMWSVVLSVQTHVTDTGDDREKNAAFTLCGDILRDFLIRSRSLKAREENRWLIGLDLGGANAELIANEDDALYGWAITFSIYLPWCRVMDDTCWEDLKQ